MQERKRERKKEEQQEEWAYTLALTDSADPLCATVTLKIGNRKTCDFTLISHWQQLLDRENEEFFPQSCIIKKCAISSSTSQKNEQHKIR